MAKCASCGKDYSIWNPASGDGKCADCSRVQVQAHATEKPKERTHEAQSTSDSGFAGPQDDVATLLRAIISNQERQVANLSSIKWGVIALTFTFILIPLLMRSCSAN